MRIDILQQVYATLAQFSSASRLYELKLDNDDDLGSSGLLVEAFLADDTLQEVGSREVIALSTSAHVDLNGLLGQRATLLASLPDGSRTGFHGYISQATMLGSEGGLARYRLRMTPWLWLLTQGSNSRVWQDKSVADIVDEVFQDYEPYAKWQWSGDARNVLADIAPRSYCCQYRETDYDFVRRLLTEEGLAWRFEDGDEEQTLMLFADSCQQTATPEDASSAAGQGLRYHAARAGEQQDSIQALRSQRSLISGSMAVLSYDYKAKKAVSVTVPTRLDTFGQHAQLPESYDYPGQYFYADGADAERYATLQMQAHEARSQLWFARSTVRTLRAGTRFALTQGPLSAHEEGADYVLLRVISVGVNNLPTPAKHGLAELFGPIPELLDELVEPLPDLPVESSAMLAQASSSGYANCFTALAADVPWRPTHEFGDARQHPKPTARGSQSAIVVGADGNDQPSGKDEIYCDSLGRVRIRFHWQDQADATCWVRVAQRSAGGGMGSQFLPRIGQEVLVQFLENDIDRPIIIGALYNGQGEGGVTPTPAGEAIDAPDSPFGRALDHTTSGQGNLVGGNSPVWHGAASDSTGHRNASAQWGLRSKEFGGSGYNQLLFDDTDSQGRVQLRSTYASTELNLGHLIHGADNFRGSVRGKGAELRTDAYGAVRGGGGLLVSSYVAKHSAPQRDPMGDNAPSIAMLKQAVKLGETFNDAAIKHQTVGLAAHLGAHKAKASSLDEKEAPLQAMLTAVSGMVGNTSLDAARSDAGERNTKPGDKHLPHNSDPIIAIAAKDGLALAAGRDLQMAASETITAMSGHDMQFATADKLRIHTSQSIGTLGGAVKPGPQNLGVQLIAGKDAIEVQAQSDVLNVQARDVVDVKSSNAHIDWAAAKKITLSTADGANITIDGGNITIQCPGKITVNAGKKVFTGPAKVDYVMPRLPHSDVSAVPVRFNMILRDIPGPFGVPIPFTEWRIVKARDMASALESLSIVLEGKSDTDGKVVLTADDELTLRKAYVAQPNNTWIIHDSHVQKIEMIVHNENWTPDQQQLHALDAMGYSDEYGTVGADSVRPFHASLANVEHKVKSASALLEKIKG
jgi:Rhs element Vgr protein